MRIVLCILINIAARAFASENAQQFDSVGELRNEVLHFIGNAERRIWMTTDYLTDGEIVTALTIARYRKIDVQVLLGRGKASLPTSRLGYLKNQGIPVFIKTGTFKPDSPTSLLIDEAVYFIDGELDSLAKYKKFHFVLGANDQKVSYEASFAHAAHVAIPANPKPIPLVGRPQQWSKPIRTNVQADLKAVPPQKSVQMFQSGVDNEGAYHYSNHSAPRPKDVTPTLPKIPIWQDRARKKESQSASSESFDGQNDESHSKKK